MSSGSTSTTERKCLGFNVQTKMLYDGRCNFASAFSEEQVKALVGKEGWAYTLSKIYMLLKDTTGKYEHLKK